MSPRNIIDRAVAANIGILGITDHNSLKQVGIVERMAAARGIFVLGGVEVTTREEIHCLAFFPGIPERTEFSKYLEQHQPFIPNKEELFGYQVVVDEEELILEHEEKLLLTALDQPIGEVAAAVHGLGGLFIPAHIDRPVNSLFSQLGFLPADLPFEALEISRYGQAEQLRAQYRLGPVITLLRNSDAHYPGDIGSGSTLFTLRELSFPEIRKALGGISGRKAIPSQPCSRA